MIAHVVLFRPHAGMPLSERHALIDAFAEALGDLSSIRRARVGRRVLMGRAYEGLMRSDFPYAAILEFDDADGVQAYLDHPAHREIATKFFAAMAETLVYDFEMEGSAGGLRQLLAGDAEG